jgi:hypothetical protein
MTTAVNKIKPAPIPGKGRGLVASEAIDRDRY